VLVLAFLIGVVAGLRSLTAPALVAWAAYLNWLPLRGTPLSFMSSVGAVATFTLLAAGELVGDKLPSTPSRTRPLGLVARIVLGGLSGACLAASASHSIAMGSMMGGIGGIAGAFAGYEGRTRLVRSLKVPDFVIACLEDAAAVGAGVFIVTR
jgi:uncharacterized membrane protein